ncbi:hypothetical protein [Baekduia sp.]|jgi:hypothetical protein|uniref:hypothetical protein n=1 Tax=Baekduia sp. TaxID=2600305 RepID=UPI002DF7E5A9|nr:hypothetical protein [Baekduia sp.]
MVTALWIISLLSGGVALGDQLRRPASEWVAADRDRSYWVSLTIIASLFCLGLIAAAAYLMSVVPQLGGAGGPDKAFRKQPVSAPRPSPPHPAPPAPAQPQSLWAPAPAASNPPAARAPLPAADAPRKLIIDFDDD